MAVRSKRHLQIISLLLILCLLLTCLPTPSNAQETTKRVMFRDDDVTPWSLGALQAVNQVHIDEGVPVTLGVIPAQSFPLPSTVQSQLNPYVPTNSSDDAFINYVRSLTSSGQVELPTASAYETFAEYLRPLASSGLFELAQHGYHHDDNSALYGVSVPTEFRGMPYDQQYTLIAEGRSLMQNAFGTAPTTFIPPYNTGDGNTLTALSNLGFTVYSSYPGDIASGGGLTLKPQILAIDETSTYASLVSQTQALLWDSSVNDIVIAYHNWKFEASPTTHVVDTAKVEMLRQYIQWLKTNNVEFTTLNGAHYSNRVTTQIALATSNPSPTINQKVTFTATLKRGTTPLFGKSVTIYHYLNDVKYTDTTATTNATGQITYVQSFGSAEERTYYASFAGDSQYANSQAGPVTEKVQKGPTTTSMSASSMYPAVNQQVTFTATLTSGGTPLSGKSVQIYHYLNGVKYTDTTATTNANGQITFAQTFGSKGLRQYNASFTGDSNYFPSTSSALNINVGSGEATTSTLTASTTTPTIGQSVTFTVNLNAGTTPLDKPVKLWCTLNGVRTDKGTFNTVNGVYTFSGSFSKTGQVIYHVEFAGDSTYTSSSGTVTVNVGTAPTTTTITASNTSPTIGQTVTFTVNLNSGSAGLSKSVKIWHTTNGVTYQDGTYATTNGVYKFTQSFGSTGQRIYHVEFAGDSSYGASSGIVTVNVGTAPTTTTITASNTSPTIGQTVTFTVNLNSGSAGLSKSVKIWHTTNGVTWQDGTFATTNGVYTFTQAFGSTGQRIYHVEFAGDSSYGGSSGNVTVNV